VVCLLWICVSIKSREKILHASRVTQYWMLIKLNICMYNISTVCSVGAGCTYVFHIVNKSHRVIRTPEELGSVSGISLFYCTDFYWNLARHINGQFAANLVGMAVSNLVIWNNQNSECGREDRAMHSTGRLPQCIWPYMIASSWGDTWASKYLSIWVAEYLSIWVAE